MENLTWKIDNEKISIILAKELIEIIDHVTMKDSLGLLNSGTYRTFTEDMNWKISIHDSGYVVVTDERSNIVHWGMFHVIKDKLREIYPTLNDN